MSFRKRIQIRLFCLIAVATLALVSCSGQQSPTLQHLETTITGKPKNVILFIGDGMGVAEVAAAACKEYGQELDADGNPGKLAFETFPAFGYLTDFSADSFVTDSAAAGTALACGVKTNNGVLGQTPDGNRVTSIADLAIQKGKAVGILSSVGLNHATPAAFYAHVAGRNDYDDIVQQFFDHSRFDLLMGGGIYGDTWTPEKINEVAAAKGYKVFTCDNIDSLTAGSVGASKVFGYFDVNNNHQLDYEATREPDNPEPHLSDLTVRALEILSRDTDGFFLMVEGGAIDWACHGNKPEEAIGETLEFSKSIQKTLDFLKARGELPVTLIIVTADHETGGLALNGPYKEILPAGKAPDIAWTSTNHTGIPVGVWATGPGASALTGKNDNTFVYKVMERAIK